VRGPLTAKAACKPFDTDGARRKAKEETARRAQARKTKQRTDAEWKEQVLEKLGKVDELVVQVRRVADALERMAGVRSRTPEDDIISWPESGGEEWRQWRGWTRENRGNKARTERRIRAKLRNRKRKMQWRVWKRVVVLLRLRTPSEL